MSGTILSSFGAPRSPGPSIAAKAAAGLPPVGVRLAEFDTFRQGYAGATVEVFLAGTTQLAPLFLDPGLSMPTGNPQTLLTGTDINGTTYGKWVSALYTFVPYTLLINDTDTTGVERPAVLSLPGQDVTLATAQARRGSYPLAISDWLDREVYAGLYGPLSQSAGSAACTATLVAAIGAAAGQGGGDVTLPAGYIPFTTLTLPQGVVLRGKGAGATTLASYETQAVITLAGDASGLADLTLDGVNVIANSIGVYGSDIDASQFDNVNIQRFETGLQLYGGGACTWRNLSVTNCSTNVDLRGDSHKGSSEAGSALANVVWEGGIISLCTANGLSLEFVDLPISGVTLIGVGFVSNAGAALEIKGARSCDFQDCYWTGNLVNLNVEDGTNTTYIAQNTVESIVFNSGSMNGGKLNFNGQCVDVQLRRMTITNVSYNLTIPQTPIILVDCLEDAKTSATGDTTKLLRLSTSDRGTVAGVTTDATTITAWSGQIPAGGAALLVVKAIARRREGPEYGIFHIQTGVERPGAQLPVGIVTTAFTAGKIVIGQTSGASARITTVSVTAYSGTLTVRDVVGTFIIGETIVDANNGSGSVSGGLVYTDVTLDAIGTTTLRPTSQTASAPGYAITCDAVAGQVRVRLAGLAGHTVEWTVEISIFEP